MNYYWIRVYYYDLARDKGEKGTLLDEFYLNDVKTRDEAKERVKERYAGSAIHFAKPKKAPGVYAIVKASQRRGKRSGNKFGNVEHGNLRPGQTM